MDSPLNKQQLKGAALKSLLVSIGSRFYSDVSLSKYSWAPEKGSTLHETVIIPQP